MKISQDCKYPPFSIVLPGKIDESFAGSRHWHGRATANAFTASTADQPNQSGLHFWLCHKDMPVDRDEIICITCMSELISYTLLAWPLVNKYFKKDL